MQVLFNQLGILKMTENTRIMAFNHFCIQEGMKATGIKSVAVSRRTQVHAVVIFSSILLISAANDAHPSMYGDVSCGPSGGVQEWADIRHHTPVPPGHAEL